MHHWLDLRGLYKLPASCVEKVVASETAPALNVTGWIQCFFQGVAVDLCQLAVMEGWIRPHLEL